jgi:hypothetical protein
MALECLKSKVGFWNGCGTRPSKLLLNDLPGFQLSDAEWITDQQRQTGFDVLESALRLGAERVEEDVIQMLYPSAKVVESWQNKTLGEIQPNKKVKTGIAGAYSGIRIRLDRAPYFAMYVNNVGFFPVSNGSGTLRIYNLLTGAEIYSQAVTWIGGQVNTFAVDTQLRFDGNPIDVIVVIDSVNVYYVNTFERGNCGTCKGRYADLMYNDMIYVLSGADKIENNLKTLGHSGGLWVNYSMQCDIADYICSLSVALKRAIWYSAGINLMDEIIYGKQINSLTTVGKDDAIALKNEYGAKYAEVMERVLNNAKLPNSPCFFCNPPVKSVTRIP